MNINKDIERKLKHLKTTNIYNQFELESLLVTYICDRVKETPNYEQRKNDVSLVKFVCLAIEEIISKKKKGLKTDKLELCVTIFTKLFGMSDRDRKILVDTVEFLHTDGQLKKTKFSYKLILKSIEYITKKIC